MSLDMSDELLPIDDQVAAFKRAIEAVVLVAHDPVAPELLAQLLEQPVVLIDQWCEELRAEYVQQQRGFELARVAGGFRYQTHHDQTPYVERFVLHDQKARLSGAALETLAIIAYKQPISRAQVASIRGVDPDGVIRTLQARGYIDEVGRDGGPGQAILFGTTAQFLEKLGLDTLDDLPPIAEFIPDADVVEALEHGLRVRPIEAEMAEVAAEVAAELVTGLATEEPVAAPDRVVPDAASNEPVVDDGSGDP
jgi:segregation and condensation protein B